MMILVTYDVNTEDADGRRRLRMVAKVCVNHGQRVQNSVFECIMHPTEFAKFKDMIEKEIDPEKDSLRYYILGRNWKKRVEHIGSKESYDPEGTMII